MVTCLLGVVLACVLPQEGPPKVQTFPVDDRYVAIETIPMPADIVLEVGGIVVRERELLVATRRGEIWRVTDLDSEQPKFNLWAEGLQEPLGLLEQDGWVYCSQRGELSRLRDADGDGRMDELQTFSDGWPLSGNYHEYCFGPARDGDGNLWLTLNKPFGDEPFGRAHWRGWAIRIDKQGRWTPVCAGLRSPAGVEAAPWGEVFYADNQGEWCAASKFAALHEGDFHGHPWGIESCKLPQSKVVHPGEVKSGQRQAAAAAAIANYRLPAVWIPYDKLGRSPAGFLWDQRGMFAPYRGQVFCGDQWSAEVFRMTIEKVGGQWQGACYPFRRGLMCGITRIAWGDDELWVGMTNRGWGSLGQAEQGLQRLRWRGVTPCDLAEVNVIAGGFRLRFTAPLQPASATAAAFAVDCYTYDLHADYGCPERDRQVVKVTSCTLAPDGLTLDLKVDGLQPCYVYQIDAPGLRAADGGDLWHHVAWYTLNRLVE